MGEYARGMLEMNGRLDDVRSRNGGTVAGVNEPDRLCDWTRLGHLSSESRPFRMIAWARARPFLVCQ